MRERMTVFSEVWHSKHETLSQVERAYVNSVTERQCVSCEIIERIKQPFGHGTE